MNISSLRRPTTINKLNGQHPELQSRLRNPDPADEFGSQSKNIEGVVGPDTGDPTIPLNVFCVRPDAGNLKLCLGDVANTPSRWEISIWGGSN